YSIGISRTWFPKVWDHNVQLSKDLIPRYPYLDYIMKECPFMAMSINIGPNAVCHKHIDIANLVSGICIILVFGKFKSRRGGHLVLHEAEVIWEGPSGTIFLIPSALIHHSNLALLAGEDRCVITLYSQAGLYRFRDQNYQT
ncbi:hypothetical protein SISSUDRAFT_972879, partial [Sistotremastrum suecicum HHB10207 ss-3]